MGFPPRSLCGLEAALRPIQKALWRFERFRGAVLGWGFCLGPFIGSCRVFIGFDTVLLGFLRSSHILQISLGAICAYKISEVVFGLKKLRSKGAD